MKLIIGGIILGALLGAAVGPWGALPNFIVGAMLGGIVSLVVRFFLRPRPPKLPPD